MWILGLNGKHVYCDQACASGFDDRPSKRRVRASAAAPLQSAQLHPTTNPTLANKNASLEPQWGASQRRPKESPLNLTNVDAARGQQHNEYGAQTQERRFRVEQDPLREKNPFGDAVAVGQPGEDNGSADPALGAGATAVSTGGDLQQQTASPGRSLPLSDAAAAVAAASFAANPRDAEPLSPLSSTYDYLTDIEPLIRAMVGTDMPSPVHFQQPDETQPIQPSDLQPQAPPTPAVLAQPHVTPQMPSAAIASSPVPDPTAAAAAAAVTAAAVSAIFGALAAPPPPQPRAAVPSVAGPPLPAGALPLSPAELLRALDLLDSADPALPPGSSGARDWGFGAGRSSAMESPPRLPAGQAPASVWQRQQQQQQQQNSLELDPYGGFDDQIQQQQYHHHHHPMTSSQGTLTAMLRSLTTIAPSSPLDPEIRRRSSSTSSTTLLYGPSAGVLPGLVEGWALEQRLAAASRWPSAVAVGAPPPPSWQRHQQQQQPLPALEGPGRVVTARGPAVAPLLFAAAGATMPAWGTALLDPAVQAATSPGLRLPQHRHHQQQQHNHQQLGYSAATSTAAPTSSSSSAAALPAPGPLPLGSPDLRLDPALEWALGVLSHRVTPSEPSTRDRRLANRTLAAQLRPPPRQSAAGAAAGVAGGSGGEAARGSNGSAAEGGGMVPWPLLLPLLEPIGDRLDASAALALMRVLALQVGPHWRRALPPRQHTHVAATLRTLLGAALRQPGELAPEVAAGILAAKARMRVRSNQACVLLVGRVIAADGGEPPPPSASFSFSSPSSLAPSARPSTSADLVSAAGAPSPAGVDTTDGGVRHDDTARRVRPPAGAVPPRLRCIAQTLAALCRLRVQVHEALPPRATRTLLRHALALSAHWTPTLAAALLVWCARLQRRPSAPFLRAYTSVLLRHTLEALRRRRQLRRLRRQQGALRAALVRTRQEQTGAGRGGGRVRAERKRGRQTLQGKIVQALGCTLSLRQERQAEGRQGGDVEVEGGQAGRPRSTRSTLRAVRRQLATVTSKVESLAAVVEAEPADVTAIPRGLVYGMTGPQLAAALEAVVRMYGDGAAIRHGPTPSPPSSQQQKNQQPEDAVDAEVVAEAATGVQEDERSWSSPHAEGPHPLLLRIMATALKRRMNQLDRQQLCRLPLLLGRLGQPPSPADEPQWSQTFLPRVRSQLPRCNQVDLMLLLRGLAARAIRAEGLQASASGVGGLGTSSNSEGSAPPSAAATATAAMEGRRGPAGAPSGRRGPPAASPAPANASADASMATEAGVGASAEATLCLEAELADEAVRRYLAVLPSASFHHTASVVSSLAVLWPLHHRILQSPAAGPEAATSAASAGATATTGMAAQAATSAPVECVREAAGGAEEAALRRRRLRDLGSERDFLLEQLDEHVVRCLARGGSAWHGRHGIEAGGGGAAAAAGGQQRPVIAGGAASEGAPSSSSSSSSTGGGSGGVGGGGGSGRRTSDRVATDCAIMAVQLLSAYQALRRPPSPRLQRALEGALVAAGGTLRAAGWARVRAAYLALGLQPGRELGVALMTHS